MNYLRVNHTDFITKDLNSAVMFRTKLRDQYQKIKSREACNRFKKQRNFYVFLLEKG